MQKILISMQKIDHNIELVRKVVTQLELELQQLRVERNILLGELAKICHKSGRSNDLKLLVQLWCN